MSRRRGAAVPAHPGPAAAERRWILPPLTAALLLTASIPVFPHAVGTSGAAVLDWHNEHISRVVSASYSWNNLGVTVLGAAGEVIEVDGRRCLRGGQFDLDVANEYAFDLDETVTLRLELLGAPNVPVLVAYDKNGGLGQVALQPSNMGVGGVRSVAVSLPRAQLADRGDFATDLMIAGQAGAGATSAPPQPLTICDVRVERSYTTPLPAPPGWLDLTVLGDTGAPAPARIGLYDVSGRMPIPSSDAVEIKKFDDRTRTYLLRAQTVWPADNKQVFYVDGRYHACLPAGRYRLVAARGIEYRLIDEELEVEAGKTLTKTVRLERWANQPAAGWYSGDVHIHYARRDDADGRAMQLQAQAEDLHVANLLQMGNVATAHFPQMGWGRDGGRLVDLVYAVVSGQEDPRTSHRGHTIHLDLKGPIRFPEEYLLYHKVFEAAAEQGGVSGYAHVGSSFGTLGADRGLALDAPFDLVDFVEIAQAGQIGTDLWIDLLDLGLRIAPAAGTDYPYIDHPGAVRSYVHVPGAYSVDGWFAGLDAGHTFVTTGPLLTFSINGAGMGDQARVANGEGLTIAASASLNPDLDRLDRIELLEQGTVVASQTAGAGDTVRLDHRAAASRSTWFVVRATGKRAVQGGAMVAVSAPIYVVVDGDQDTWKRDAVPGIVERFLASLDQLEGSALASPPEQEWWESGPVWQQAWAKQLAALGERIEAARSRLRALAARAREN